MSQVEFEVWMGLVDEKLQACGLGVMDLADAPYRDMYDDECSPEEMVRCVLIDWNDMDEETFEQIFGEGYGL